MDCHQSWVGAYLIFFSPLTSVGWRWENVSQESFKIETGLLLKGEKSRRAYVFWVEPSLPIKLLEEVDKECFMGIWLFCTWMGGQMSRAREVPAHCTLTPSHFHSSYALCAHCSITVPENSLAAQFTYILRTKEFIVERVKALEPQLGLDFHRIRTVLKCTSASSSHSASPQGRLQNDKLKKRKKEKGGEV